MAPSNVLKDAIRRTVLDNIPRSSAIRISPTSRNSFPILATVPARHPPVSVIADAVLCPDSDRGAVQEERPVEVAGHVRVGAEGEGYRLFSFNIREGH